jgi:hypothetical protein
MEINSEYWNGDKNNIPSCFEGRNQMENCNLTHMKQIKRMATCWWKKHFYLDGVHHMDEPQYGCKSTSWNKMTILRKLTTWMMKGTAWELNDMDKCVDG